MMECYSEQTRAYWTTVLEFEPIVHPLSTTQLSVAVQGRHDGPVELFSYVELATLWASGDPEGGHDEAFVELYDAFTLAIKHHIRRRQDDRIDCLCWSQPPVDLFNEMKRAAVQHLTNPKKGYDEAFVKLYDSFMLAIKHHVRERQDDSVLGLCSNLPPAELFKDMERAALWSLAQSRDPRDGHGEVFVNLYDTFMLALKRHVRKRQDDLVHNLCTRLIQL